MYGIYITQLTDAVAAALLHLVFCSALMCMLLHTIATPWLKHSDSAKPMHVTSTSCDALIVVRFILQSIVIV